MHTHSPIGTALAAFGASGRYFHAPFIHSHAGFRLHGVWERTKNKAQAVYPDIITYRTFSELLADPAIELVVLNTPNHLHVPLGLQAIQAGKHLLVEKPLAHSSSEARKLVVAAQQKGVLLTVYHNRRWDGDFLTIKHLVQQQMLGRLVEFESYFQRFRNYIKPNSWKEAKDTAAGTLYDLGSHLIDQALHLFGRPQRVQADIRWNREGTYMDDYFHLLLHYPETAVILKGGYLVREPGPRFVLNGTQGSFRKWGFDPQEQALQQGQYPGTPNWGHEAETHWGTINSEWNGMHVRGKLETTPGNYLHFYEALYQALRNGGELPVTAEEALQVVEVIEAAYKSQKSGNGVVL